MGVKMSSCRDSRDGEGTGDRVCKGSVTAGGRDSQHHKEACGARQGRENPTVSPLLYPVSFHR